MNTINVVEINGDDGLVSSLRSFPAEQVQTAEALFRKLCEETTDLDSEGIDNAIEDGFAEVPGGASIQLVHSTN